MATKTRRMEFRAQEADLLSIQKAASILHEQPTEFVRKAALQRAQDVLRQELVTVMDAEQFDELMASLDDADDNPKLAAAARKPRVYTRD